MHLLRKNLILASLASVAMVGLLSSSSASALDGFSLYEPGQWELPWANWGIPQVNYNITDGAGNGAIAIKKVDEQGNPLANAKFKIDGVTALYVNGKYIYSTELGLYSEFTTDENGQAIVAGLPFGTYRVTETVAPEGYARDSRTYEVVVGEDNMAEVEYERQSFLASESGSTFDMTDAIATAPDNQLFLVGDDDSDLGRGIYLEYDPSEEIFTNADNRISVKKVDSDRYSFLVEDDEDDMTLSVSRTEYDEKIYSGVITTGEAGIDYSEQYWVKENSDGTVTVKWGNDEEVVCALDNDSVCIVSSSNHLTLRKGNGGYYFEFADGALTGIVLEYDQKTGRYTILSQPAFALYINEIDETTIYLYQSLVINYSKVINRYITPPLYAPVAFETEATVSTLLATPLTISNSPLSFEEDSAENIINPATGDVAAKVFVIAIGGLAPIFIFRKQLTKRAN